MQETESKYEIYKKTRTKQTYKDIDRQGERSREKEMHVDSR